MSNLNFVFSGTSVVSTIFTVVVEREDGTVIMFGKAQYKDGSHSINYFNHSTTLEYAHNNVFIYGEHYYQGIEIHVDGVMYVLHHHDKVRGVCIYTKY